MEKLIEKAMYRSRWILAPIYLGLSIAVMALCIKFFQEAFYLLLHTHEMPEAKLILKVLTMIDLAMVGGLLVMVMMSGYENFVSQLDIDEGEERLTWLGKMDSSSLKAKIAASIVAISSIHLLKVFMGVSEYTDDFQMKQVMWYVILHLTFVGSAFAMGYLDVIGSKAEK